MKDEGNERIIYPETFKIARFKRRYSVINNFKIRGQNVIKVGAE